MPKSVNPKVGSLVQIKFWDHAHSYEANPKDHCEPVTITVVGWITRILDKPMPCINIGNFIDKEVTQCDEYCILKFALQEIKVLK